MNYVGIDLGTSSVKLLLVNENGEILKSASREYPLSFPKNGWSEQNPEDWIKGTEDALFELLDGVDPLTVGAFGVGGQMHGLVALDKDDNVIRPAILWNDGRTEKETEYLNEVVGKEKLTSLTGNIAFAGFTAPKILWMRENEPELFEKISKVMLPKDYINYYFTGVFATDPSDASGMLLYDVKNKCWSEEMLSICHLDESKVAKVFESYEPIGKIKPSIAQKFGLSSETIFCAGAGDNAAAAVGCGVTGKGKCNISLGTSGTVFITNDTFSVDKGNALHSFAHADGGFHQMGCILSAASCNKWWLEILKGESHKEEEKNIDNLGENNVYFLPYLMGERSPHNDVNVRGSFFGLSMDTKREDMTLAVLEGVSFAVRDCVEAAKNQGIVINESKVCGGGAKSSLWMKILPSVLGINLIKLKTEEGPAYGGAILAAVARGDFKTVAECGEKWVEPAMTFEPDPSLSEKYESKYLKWKKLYPMVKEFYK